MDILAENGTFPLSICLVDEKMEEKITEEPLKIQNNQFIL